MSTLPMYVGRVAELVRYAYELSSKSFAPEWIRDNGAEDDDDNGDVGLPNIVLRGAYSEV